MPPSAALTMFRNTQQHVRAVRTLLSLERLERLWGASGPTVEAVELLHAEGETLSSSEALLLRAAFDFWNGNGSCALNRMFKVLDHRSFEAICTLALAVTDVTDSHRAVDRWIVRHERRAFHAMA